MGMLKEMLLPFVGGVDADRQSVRAGQGLGRAAPCDRCKLGCLQRPMRGRCRWHWSSGKLADSTEM